MLTEETFLSLDCKVKPKSFSIKRIDYKLDL